MLLEPQREKRQKIIGHCKRIDGDCCRHVYRRQHTHNIAKNHLCTTCFVFSTEIPVCTVPLTKVQRQ
eukprot:XP_001706097.1 Hypothetical protein GL50803_36067 [Giardia lamblia ATCC 50803]